MEKCVYSGRCVGKWFCDWCERGKKKYSHIDRFDEDDLISDIDDAIYRIKEMKDLWDVESIQLEIKEDGKVRLNYIRKNEKVSLVLGEELETLERGVEDGE